MRYDHPGFGFAEYVQGGSTDSQVLRLKVFEFVHLNIEQSKVQPAGPPGDLNPGQDVQRFPTWRQSDTPGIECEWRLDQLAEAENVSVDQVIERLIEAIPEKV